MSKNETVEVTVKLPRAVIDYIEDFDAPIEEYIPRVVVELAASTIEDLDPKQLIEKYGLKPVFKEHGVYPRYYETGEEHE